jgi:amidohydrolase
MPDPSAPLAPSHNQGATLPLYLDEWLSEHQAGLIAIRRHIHSHPELSGAEFETAALVARKLIDAGLSPTLMPQKNGVLCDIGPAGPVVALRADLDALPLPDVKDVPYRSTVPNVCHACGHDVHTTVVLGAGLVLAKMHEEGNLPGRVRLIFQPAEERLPSGAPDVIEAGGLDDVHVIFGLHCAPQLPCGTIAVRSGNLTSAADFLEVRLYGPGGHAARPHLTSDLVYTICKIATQVPAILSRRMDTRSGASVVFGAISAGDDASTIPSEAVLRGTSRVLDRAAWDQLPALVTEIIHGVAEGSGATVEVNYMKGLPPVINDRFATAIVAGAGAAALGGSERVLEADVSMGGEDFACYLEETRGAMFRLGVAPPHLEHRHDIHQSNFDVDERAIGFGIRVLVHTALAAMSDPSFQ